MKLKIGILLETKKFYVTKIYRNNAKQCEYMNESYSSYEVETSS